MDNSNYWTQVLLDALKEVDIEINQDSLIKIVEHLNRAGDKLKKTFTMRLTNTSINEQGEIIRSYESINNDQTNISDGAKIVDTKDFEIIMALGSLMEAIKGINEYDDNLYCDKKLKMSSIYINKLHERHMREHKHG